MKKFLIVFLFHFSWIPIESYEWPQSINSTNPNPKNSLTKDTKNSLTTSPKSSLSRRKRETSTRHKIPLSPVQAYRNRLKNLPSHELHTNDHETFTNHVGRTTTESPTSTTFSPRNYLPLPPPPPEIMSDVPNGITSPIREYLMPSTNVNPLPPPDDTVRESTGSSLRSISGTRNPRYLHGMSEENAFIYYPSNYRSASPDGATDKLIDENLIDENSINENKPGDAYERVVRVRGRARRIKVTRRPSLIPVVIEEVVTHAPPAYSSPTHSPPAEEVRSYNAPLENGHLVDSSGSRSIYTTPTLESFGRKDMRREHIHKCLLNDYQSGTWPQDGTIVIKSDQDWIQSELESTCKMYIDKIEEIRSQCWTALSDLRAKKYIEPAEDRKQWWKNLPFG